MGGIAVAGVAMSLVGTGAITGAAEAASPPSVVTGPPSSIGVVGATVSGDVNPEGLPTSWFFQYGTTTAYGLHSAPKGAGAAAAATDVSARLQGLTPGTVYHYRLVSTSHAGSAYGSDASFRTPAVPPTILTSAVSSVHDTTARLSATIDPNGLATTWYVRYGTLGNPSSPTATHAVGSAAGPMAVALTIQNLTPHTTYDIEAVATNAAGARVGTGTLFVTTGPPLVTAQSVAALSPTSATIGGSIVPDGHATSWYVQYGTTPSYVADSPVRHLGASMATIGVAAPIAKLTANTTYHFRLVARNADGTAVGGDAVFTTPGPTLSSSAGAVDFGRAVTLSGSVPTPAANENVSVYERDATSPSFVEIATVLTGAGGTWSYSLTPRIGATYEAMWDAELSPTVGVGVSPSVLFRARADGRVVTHVAGAASFVGHVVRLQRWEHGAWRSVSTRRLNHDSAAAFRPTLPAGSSRLRVFLSGYQAGPGYLPGTSAVHVLHKR